MQHNVRWRSIVQVRDESEVSSSRNSSDASAGVSRTHRAANDRRVVPGADAYAFDRKLIAETLHRDLLCIKSEPSCIALVLERKLGLVF